LLEGLLCVDIDGGEPAAETGMGMVPAYNCLWSGSRQSPRPNVSVVILPSCLP
jgi:hypothetical protein